MPGCKTGQSISKQAMQPILKQVSPFQNGPAHFKTGQKEFPNQIGLASFKMGWPILKWAACFKMGQILNQAVTYIHPMYY